MRIALVGASGQLGTDFKKIIPGEFVSELDFPLFDITKRKEAELALARIKPDIIINTAAYNLVDKAESWPEEAFAVNYVGVENLAKICRQMGVILVHFSTDYVFGGDCRRTRPYVEHDQPAPVNKYGESKLAGEKSIQKILRKYFIVRTSGLFGEAGSQGKGGNFVEAIIKKVAAGEEIRVVDDQILTPTYTLDLAKNCWELIQGERYGLYHITSEGQCSWYDFARVVFRFLNLPDRITPIASSELGQKAQRPSYCVLKNKALEDINLNLMRHWEASIPDYLREKKYLF